MRKLTTTMMQETLNKHDGRLTVGLDLGDRSSFYCVLDGRGDVLLEQKVSTTPKAINETFGAMPRSRIAVETGTHSPWVSRLLSELGHETIVAHARSVRLIGESRRKDDRLDAMTLARLVRIDPRLLCPVKHRSAEAQADLTVIRARAALVRARTMLVNAVRGLTKSYGERLRGCNARGMKPKAAQDLSPELKYALEPMMRGIESASERICEYDQMLESMLRNRYPEAERLKQIKGVGTLIALTYMLTLEDPYRFRKSRDAACYVGLQPGRRNSGQSDPQMHISKEGDPYLRALLVQAAHHVLGPWGVDSDLRRWGMKLAEHGGKRGKKRAVIAVARKLAVLLHRLWVSGDVYVRLRPACQTYCRQSRSSVQIRRFAVISRVPVTASLAWPNTPSARSSERSQYQVAAPAESRTPNLHRASKRLTPECGWKGGDRTARKRRRRAPLERSSSATLFARIHFDIAGSSAVKAQD